MASIRIVLDPAGEGGLGPEFVRGHLDGRLIHLSDDAEVAVSGLEHGMQGGRPSMVLGFVLPDGTPVIVETSWRLFAAAFWNFAARFGDERPDATGMAIEYDPTGGGDKVRLDLIPDDALPWFECELCGDRFEAREAGEAGALEVTQFIHKHFREKHPDSAVPTVPGPKL